jgi:hypothetical protein
VPLLPVIEQIPVIEEPLPRDVGPGFVVELPSPSDDAIELQAMMTEYVACACVSDGPSMPTTSE